jgi:hypothetical protein
MPNPINPTLALIIAPLLSSFHWSDCTTAASRTLEPNQVLILLAARPTGAQWLCPPLYIALGVLLVRSPGGRAQH